MYPRKYSLKTRYYFSKTLKTGQKFDGQSIIILYIPIQHNDGPKFGIIVSTKFSKKAVIKSKVKRIIGEAIRINIDNFNKNYYYVFIPKKNMLGNSDKMIINVEKISFEINTFLSKMVIS